MQLKCLVNQKEALRLGVNAPHSTIVLDVDPAILTRDERDAIAVMITDGHDLTAHGICPSGYHCIFAEQGNTLLPLGRAERERIKKEKLEADKLAKQKSAALEAEREAVRKAEANRCNAVCIGTLESQGSEAQKEMRKRGLMTDAIAAGIGRGILEDLAFAGCPLSKFIPPSESDIDDSDWREEHQDTDGYEMPRVIQDRHVITAADMITCEVMERIIAAEHALRAWAPIVSATPILARISRDDSGIPWSENVYGVRVTRDWNGIMLVRDFALPLQG